MLWNLATDPRETSDVSAAEPERCRRMRAWIAQARHSPIAPAPLIAPAAGARVAAHLRALGYLA